MAARAEGPQTSEWEEGARERIEDRARVCKRRADKHGWFANLWVGVAEPLRWITFTSAALSGLTVIADARSAATVLSVVTAVLAATQAAFNPVEKLASNRIAAKAYDRLKRQVEDFLKVSLPALREHPEEERRQAVTTFLSGVEDRIQKIEEDWWRGVGAAGAKT